MSKLKKPKSAKETQSSQVPISAFFEKNVLLANKGLAPGGNTAAEKHTNSIQFQRVSDTSSANEHVPYASPINCSFHKTHLNRVDSDVDDCIIPDTPENFNIPKVSRIPENSFGKSFTRRNILSSELPSKVAESKALILNASVAYEKKVAKSIVLIVNASVTDKQRGSQEFVPVIVSRESNQSSLKRSSDHTASSSKRTDKKKTPRKSVQSPLVDNKSDKDDFRERRPSKADDTIHRPPSKRDKFIPPSIQPSSRIAGLVPQKKTSLINPRDVTLDLNADTDLQNALKELSEFNRLDISECRNRRKSKSGEFSNEKTVVADTQLIDDFSPVNSDKLPFKKSSSTLISANVRSRLTDRIETDRRPLKQMENLDAFTNERVKQNISELDSDAVLLSALQELNEQELKVPVNISRNHNVPKDKLNVSDITEQDSQLISDSQLIADCDDSFDCNVIDSSEITSSLPLKAVFKQEINIFEQTSGEHAIKYKPAFHEFGRHVVVNVTKHPRETVLDLRSVSDGRLCQAILSGFWQDTFVSVDDTVNVIGTFDLDNICRVTDKQNFVVVNPDMLVSGTTIVSTMRCMRRSVLSQKFKGSDFGNDAMLYGSILHAIFQEVLVGRSTTQSQVASVVELVLTRPEFLHEMYAQEMREKNVRSEILKYCPEIEAFINNHVRRGDFKPQTTSNFKDNGKKPSLPMFVVNVTDVEENIWSPRYGAKGKIDLTVEVKLLNERKQWTNSVIPLELKTGKATFSSEHKGQVMLYTMMSEDRRPRSSTSGLLLYLKDLSMQLVTDCHAQKRGLIQLRNEFAHYVRKSQRCVVRNQEVCDEGVEPNWKFGALPPPINDEFSCSKCPQVLNCCLYQSGLESHVVKPPHVLLQLVPETLAHLNAAHLDFFRRWCEMLHLEMTSSNAEEGGVSGLWMSTGEELESLGKCLSQLEIIPSECHSLENGKFRQTFRPAAGHSRARRLCDVGLAAGSSLIVSAENKPYIALTTGLVTNVTGETVTLVTDRDLRLYPDCAETVYRLDNCDTYNSMSTSLNNLSRLMENKAVCAKLRALVVERRAPEFQLTLSKVTINKVKDIFKLLNKPQKAAVLKIMMSKDYVLIKGYPGTGKTSTIVALVRIMTLLGQSVLLTSYTHSAVDNILLKLKQANVDFLRIGRLERVHPELHEYTAERLQQTVTTVDQLDELYRSKSVVATTCLAMNHAIFARRKFDVCVVDEATQVLLPACLSSLFAADRFVLVGDPKQLPPIVHNKEAKRLGMDRSLFTHLEDAGGTYSLTLQYRMNGEIMRLSNALTYGGALHCASREVAEARLKINSSVVACESRDWLRRCVSNQPGDEVLWLNTDTMIQTDEEMRNDIAESGTEGYSREKSSSGLQSTTEAKIVRSIVEGLMLGGVAGDDIGVITPYRQQVLLLRQTINTGETRQDVLLSATGQVEINTVDQYQGRDKPVIIVSFVKSRDSHASEILKDVRRLNVAITRAKHKLIFVGSVETLSSYEDLQNLITEILTTNQIVALA